MRLTKWNVVLSLSRDQAKSAEGTIVIKISNSSYCTYIADTFVLYNKSSQLHGLLKETTLCPEPEISCL